MGLSWGGAVAPIVLAVESRFKTAVLESGGLEFQQALPEADQINFVTRVRIPVLMFNGRYDHFFPVESSQHPAVSVIGTPEKDKKHVIYETGHAVPRKEFIRETPRLAGQVHRAGEEVEAAPRGRSRMDEILRTNCRRELEWQVSFARIAMRDLRAALTEMDQAARDFRAQREWFDVGSWTTLLEEFNRRRTAATRRFWYSAQGFLLAVANISRLLWPAEVDPGGKSRVSVSRGNELRVLLGLPARSPLTDRAVRNFFEHFDEGLDLWAERERKNLADAEAGPTTRVADMKNRFRNYDPVSETLTFQGEQISLRELSDALDDLARRLEAA